MKIVLTKKMLGISCDLGVDESCMVGYTIDMGGNIKIDWVKNTKKKKKVSSFNDMCEMEYAKTIKKLTEDPLIKKMLKEVKKVKPYLETKIVKVKKEKKDFWCGGMRIDDKQYKVFKRKKGIPYLKEFKKGNWVNGENLDKIKFPCFCSYKDGDIRKIGMFNRVFFRGEYFYVITDCSQQYVDSNGEQFYHPSNLEMMFKRYDIHILKGKIILYEEE